MRKRKEWRPTGAERKNREREGTGGKGGGGEKEKRKEKGARGKTNHVRKGRRKEKGCVESVERGENRKEECKKGGKTKNSKKLRVETNTSNPKCKVQKKSKKRNTHSSIIDHPSRPRIPNLTMRLRERHCQLTIRRSKMYAPPFIDFGHRHLGLFRTVLRVVSLVLGGFGGQRRLELRI
jgi:hypothetical protein